MDRVSRLSSEDRRELWGRAAGKLRPLPDFMIEKDFWVCFALRQLFALPGAGDHFIFKGGTSLSKVWRAIHRFSEDIDISLSREWLGFGGSRDPEAAGTRKQRGKLLEALSEACAERLRRDVAPALRKSFAGALGSRGWGLEFDPDDDQKLLFAYPTTFPEMAGSAYTRPVVAIECGARSDRWPVGAGRVTPYVAEAFPDALPGAGVDVPVLDIERTFWEKATILHAEAHRPAEKPVPERYSRHYADLAVLARSGVAAKALGRSDLRARVVAHKLVFFPSAWTKMELALPGTFRLLPQAHHAAELERDYASMAEMFFRDRPSWPDVLVALETLEREINATAEEISET